MQRRSEIARVVGEAAWDDPGRLACSVYIGLKYANIREELGEESNALASLVIGPIRQSRQSGGLSAGEFSCS